MLGCVEFGKGELQGGRIGCDLRKLEAFARGGEARIRELYAVFDGREITGFQIRQLFPGSRCGGGWRPLLSSGT